MDDPLRIAAVLLVVLVAAVVKGAIGFGFPLVSVPLIAVVWDTRSAVILLSLTSVATNIPIVLRGGNRGELRRVIPTAAGLTLGMVGGAWLLVLLDVRLLTTIVGAAALIFAITSLAWPRLAIPARLERVLAFPMGMIAGVMGGSTSITSPVLASYIHALHLAPRDFVYVISALFLLGNSVQSVAYAQLGLFDPPMLAMIAASMVPLVTGVYVGMWLQGRIEPFVFRRIVLCVIALSGASLVWRGIVDG